MPPPQLDPFSLLGYYTYKQGTRQKARRSAPRQSQSPYSKVCLRTHCECREYKRRLPPTVPSDAPVKYFITSQQEDRRMRRAAAVEWTLAGVLFLFVAAVLAKIFHAL
jgi:hypothetical protein